MPPNSRKRLYCYVDETGQDASSSVFIVVAVVNSDNQEEIRQALIEVEHEAGTGHRKWHKSRPERRIRYLELVVQKKLAAGDVYFGTYLKPLPYFLPLIDVLELAIKTRGEENYSASVVVDGIDRQKARELTNALRLRGISLEMVKGRRDESEPLIRLADMWAGCIRGAFQGAVEEGRLIDQAIKKGRVVNLNKRP